MPIIDTGSGTLYYEVNGSGPPVVLMRGLGRSVRHWLGYERNLAKRARVITVELRGMGLSTRRMRWRDGLFTNADDVAQVLDHLQIRRAHIAGVSLGGMVALAFGLKYPHRTTSIVVMNTSIAGQRTLRLSPKAVLALSQVMRFRDERFHAALVDVLLSPDCPAEKKADVIRQYAAIAEQDGFGVATVLKQLAGASRFLVKRKLERLELPTLVMYGADDQFVPNVNSRKLAHLMPHAEVLEIAGAGHEITLDKPEEVTAALGDWIGRYGT